jgi:hypothetical protein
MAIRFIVFVALVVTCAADLAHAQQVSLSCSEKTIPACPTCKSRSSAAKQTYITFDLTNMLVVRADEHSYRITNLTDTDIFWGRTDLPYKASDVSGHFNRASLSGKETFGGPVKITNYYEKCRVLKPRF